MFISARRLAGLAVFSLLSGLLPGLLTGLLTGSGTPPGVFGFDSATGPVPVAHAQQAPRGIDPAEAARRDREERLKRERARTDNVNCFLRERKRESDQTITCLYTCPTLGGRTDSVSVGAGGSCPNTLGVLRRP